MQFMSANSVVAAGSLAMARYETKSEIIFCSIEASERLSFFDSGKSVY